MLPMLAKLNSFLSYGNLLIATGIIVILKIFYIVLIQKEFVGLEDFAIAQNIVAYHQYSQFINLGGTAFKLPVYPLFLSFFIWSLGNNALLGVAIVQALISFFIPLLLFRILRLIGLEKVGVLAGFLYILSPAYFLYSGIIEATNVFVPLLLLWLYFYFKIWCSKEKRMISFIIFGFVTAILFLTQVVIVPLACLMILALLIYERVSFKNFALMACTAILFYSPWVIRNYYVFDKIIPSKTPVWQNIYFGFTPKGQLWKDLQLITAERDHNLYQMSDENDELAMEKIYKEETLKATQGDPQYFIKKALSNLLCLWYVPPKYVDDQSWPVIAGRKIYVVILDLLTLISLFFLYKKSKMVFWFSVLFFSNFSLPYMIGHAANMRFKLDFEWYQLVLVSFLLMEILAHFLSKKSDTA